MILAPSGVTTVFPRFLAVLLLALTASSLSIEASTAPQSIAVLDSLIGDSTLVEGRVIYVDFWASWCVPCRRSFPWMMDMLNKYADRGLQVVAINLDRDEKAAAKFLEQTRSSLPIVYDPKGNLAKLYDLQVMPTSFLYGRDGSLRQRNEGFVPEEKESMEALIRKLLEEKPGK